MNSPNTQYHIERARAELDMAYRAEQRVAAEAHMRLSALHMERALGTAPMLLEMKQVARERPPLRSSDRDVPNGYSVSVVPAAGPVRGGLA